MAEPVPIKSGIAPEFDTEREMLDYFMQEMRTFREVSRVPPSRIAVVLIGYNDGYLYSRAGSWTTNTTGTKLETCSMAAALLMQRAVKDDD